ncbi:MCE family protein [Nocardia sp. 2YAB30]|uniref:MCE family protein n=1 Tax=unclassified Nocardia TaxID=2637762 RepID=UPI003F9C3B7A
MRLIPDRIRTDLSEGRREFRWGSAGLAIAAIIIAVAGLVRLIPANEQGHVAEFRDSGGLQAGDEVRIAGVPVGRVRTVELADDHVRVGFTVHTDQPVGDHSTAEVRLLTPVGGHYLALTPAGAQPLGAQPIPRERTRTPYELTDVFEQSAPRLDGIDGSTLRQTVAELDAALANQPDAPRGILDSLTGLTTTITAQSDRLDRAIRVSDEYVATIATDRAVLAGFVRELGIISAKLGQAKTEVIRAFQLLRRLTEITHRPIMAYADSLEPAVTDLEQLLAKVADAPERLDTVIASINDFIVKIAALSGTGEPAGAPRPDLCVPRAGKDC